MLMNASKANFVYNDLDENFEYDNAGLYEKWDNQRPSIEEHIIYINTGLEFLYFYSSHFFIVDSKMKFSLEFKLL